MTAPEPPPIPPDAPAAVPARRGGLSTTAIVLIVCGVLALPLVAGVVTTVAIVVPRMQETRNKITCMSNLSELSQRHLMASMEDPRQAVRWSGSALWLAQRRGGVRVRRGEEKLLLCPGDDLARPPQSESDRAEWDSVDLKLPPRHLCSYAGRDFAAFPIDPDDGEKHPIGACVHHRGGAVIAFDAGDVLFFSRADLGIAPDAEITFGPDSASPLLRTLTGGN